MNVSNSAGAVKGWDRESIFSAMAKMAKFERPARYVRLSSATFHEFYRRYIPVGQTAGESQAIDRLFGLEIVFDETMKFGEYKFEPEKGPTDDAN